MTFANPAMLWGLLALFVPIAVHLFNFRRYRRLYFSNVDRLGQLRSETQRHSTLRRWVLLAVRLLALALLVLAFARPTLSPSGSALRSGATAVSLFVDNSFSMGSIGSDGPLIEQACRKAREVADAYPPDTRFQLLTSDMFGQQFQWLSRQELLDALDGIQVGPASPPLEQVVRRQLDFLSNSAAPNRHAYLISDFQSSSLPSDGELPTDDRTTLSLVPLQGLAADNLYIDTLTLDAPAYFVGGAVAVNVRVCNSGAQPAEKVPLRLLVDGRERALATLDIPPHASAQATLRFTLDSAGWFDALVQLTDHPITFDDSYYFSLLAGQPVQMLQVDASTPNPSLNRLFPDDDPAVRRTLAPLPPDLSPYHFILLNQPTAMPSGQAAQLRQWVADGGTLAIIPPPHTETTTTNSQLNDLLALLGAPQLASWTTQPLRASRLNRQASLYRNVFTAPTDHQMEMPTAFAYYRLSQTPEPTTPNSDLITLPDGSPLLTAYTLDAGRVYLFTTPLLAQYTDLPNQALFVPTLYNMALYSQPQPQPHHLLTDTRPINAQRSTLNAQLTNPPTLTSADGSHSVIPELRHVANRTLLLLHGQLPHAGHYRLTHNPEPSTLNAQSSTLNSETHLAFNYDRRESEMTFPDPSELTTHNPQLSTLNPKHPLQQAIRTRATGTPLWRHTLILALLALAAEALLVRKPQTQKSEIRNQKSKLLLLPFLLLPLACQPTTHPTTILLVDQTGLFADLDTIPPPPHSEIKTQKSEINTHLTILPSPSLDYARQQALAPHPPLHPGRTAILLIPARNNTIPRDAFLLLPQRTSLPRSHPGLAATLDSLLNTHLLNTLLRDLSQPPAADYRIRLHTQTLD